jgi:hypothetical protein
MSDANTQSLAAFMYKLSAELEVCPSTFVVAGKGQDELLACGFAACGWLWSNLQI